MKTRPIRPSESGPVPVLGLPPMPAPRVPTILVLVAVPLSACSPLDVRYGQRPTRVIDVEGVALTGWRAA